MQLTRFPTSVYSSKINASLASQIRTEYMKCSILYDRILRARISSLNKSDTSFSVDINSPSKSLKGVLLIFTQERSATKFGRDTEEIYNPKVKKVEITVEGLLTNCTLRIWNTATSTMKLLNTLQKDG